MTKRLRRKNFFEPIPENAVLVARPSRYHNPFTLELYGREQALKLYEEWLDRKLKEDPNFLEPLRGKDLVCYCPLDLPCHADIILKKLENI